MRSGDAVWRDEEDENICRMKPTQYPLDPQERWREGGRERERESGPRGLKAFRPSGHKARKEEEHKKVRSPRKQALTLYTQAEQWTRCAKKLSWDLEALRDGDVLARHLLTVTKVISA